MKFIAVACAVTVLSGTNAAIERARFGMKGGSFDLSGFDGSGKDIFGFDNAGVDKWGRPVTDASAGLVAPLGRANGNENENGQHHTGSGKSNNNEDGGHAHHGHSKGSKVDKPKKKVNKVNKTTIEPIEPTPTPSISGIPITWTLSSTKTSSNFIPTTAVFTTAHIIPDPTPLCSNVVVFELNVCLESESLIVTNSGIVSIGDFFISGFFLANIGTNTWQFVDYKCNVNDNKSFLTVLTCGGEPFRRIPIVLRVL